LTLQSSFFKAEEASTVLQHSPEAIADEQAEAVQHLEVALNPPVLEPELEVCV